MSNDSTKILLSGITPSGRPHIGNYFGAMKQFVDLQNSYKSFIFISDYHALITVQDKKRLEENILGVLLDYLAIGLNPETTLIYKQSDVSAHTELAWIFNCLITVPYLERAHAYKDKQAKGIEATVGLFDYPSLMAADILLYDAEIVPVGQDQQQHLEIAREIARKFNTTFGDTFKEPKAMILDAVKIVPGTDGQKMSKSYNNTIPLFASDEEIRKAVMSIPTDSQDVSAKKDPEKDHVFALHKLFTTGDEFTKVKAGYEEGGLSYKDSKEILIKNISAFIAPLREKRAALEKDTAKVLEILKKGGEKARAIAEKKMDEVREKIGVKLY